MIVDLDQDLYVIDKRTHEHKVKFIDPVQKIVYAENIENAEGVVTIIVKIESDTINTTDEIELGVFYYGTHPLTVTLKQ